MTAPRLSHKWQSVDAILTAMQRDARVGSRVDMEVGACSVLSLMNDMRQEHKVRQQRFSKESISKLEAAAHDIAKAATTGRTSTAVQTAAVALLRMLAEAEEEQDNEWIAGSNK